MKCWKLKNIFKSFDLFAKPVTLRYQGEPQYESITGGICSIALVIVFVSVFTGTLLNTLNKTYITSTTTKSQEIDPTSFQIGTDRFMFALGLSGINMNDGPRWFDVIFQFRHYRNLTKSKISVPLQRCTTEQWTQIDPSFIDFYRRLKLEEWLCPTSNFILQLQGKYTSEVFKFYKIGIKQCNSTLNPSRPCVTASQIDGYLNSTQAFNLNFYFVNTILNPEDDKHISYYINDFNYFPFSTTTGCNTNMYVSSYTVETDQSIYPFQQLQQQTGGIVVTEAQMLNYQVRQTQYLKLNVRKSSLSLKVSRSYRKLDDTISYIGGLFSAILSALVLIGMYNQFSYQLDIAQNLYKYDKDQSINLGNFNIFFYIGYLIYLAFSKFSINLPWKRMKIYHRSVEEVRKQMDIKYVFKKLHFVEKVTDSVLDEHQLKALHLHGNSTLDEAQVVRKDYKFYEKLQKYYLQFEQQKNRNLLLTTENCDQALIKEKNQINNENNRFGYVQPVKINVIDINSKFQDDPINDPVVQKQNIHQIMEKMEGEDEENFSEDQINNSLNQLKECLKILKKEGENGEKLSRKVLSNIDEKFINKISEMESYQKEKNYTDAKSEFEMKSECSTNRFKVVQTGYRNRKNKNTDAENKTSLNQSKINNSARIRAEPKSIQDIEEVKHVDRRK